MPFLHALQSAKHANTSSGSSSSSSSNQNSQKPVPSLCSSFLIQRSLTGTFSGESKENYQGFLDYLKKHPILELIQGPEEELARRFSILGAVADSKKYFFEQSATVEAYAKEFFEYLFSQPDVLEAFNKHQVKKFKDTHKRVNLPQCISLVSATMGSSRGPTSLCFLAISSLGNEADLWQAVDSALDRYQGPCRFELLDRQNRNYHELVAAVLKEGGQEAPEDATRDCSEKIFGPECAKLFFNRYALGQAIHVTGAFTVSLYPYEEAMYEPDYQAPRHLLSPTAILDRNEGEVFEVEVKTETEIKKYRLPILECCPNCQKNKVATLALMYAGMCCGIEYQEMFATPTRASSIVLTSPAQVQVTPSYAATVLNANGNSDSPTEVLNRSNSRGSKRSAKNFTSIFMELPFTKYLARPNESKVDDFEDLPTEAEIKKALEFA